MISNLEISGVTRHPDTGISVLIVGGGVGGLATALECRRKGHQVRVIEKSPGPQTEGDHFTIGASATRVIKKWPELAEDHDRFSISPSLTAVRPDGSYIFKPQPIIETSPGNSDNDSARIHRHLRSTFQKILLNQLEKIGIIVNYDQKVSRYSEESDRGIVQLENGTELSADVVVAADGIGTRSHELVLGKPLRARSSGYAIYRTAYPAEFGYADPLVKQRFGAGDSGEPVAEIWIGPDMHFVAINSNETFGWSLTHKDDGKSAETWDSNHQPCKPTDVIKTLNGFPGSCPDILKRLVETVPEDRLVDWKIMWRDPQPTWVSPMGRVVQLGDAAHTFVPSAGSGANQAIEDATSLATCLQIGGQSNIPLALMVHNKLRSERVSCCQLMGFRNQASRHVRDWNSIEDNVKALKSQVGHWVLSHDAEQYAYDNYGKLLRHLLEGTDFCNTNIPPGYVYEPWDIDELLAKVNRGEVLEFPGDWS